MPHHGCAAKIKARTCPCVAEMDKMKLNEKPNIEILKEPKGFIKGIELVSWWSFSNFGVAFALKALS